MANFRSDADTADQNAPLAPAKNTFNKGIFGALAIAVVVILLGILFFVIKRPSLNSQPNPSASPHSQLRSPAAPAPLA